MIGLTVVVRHRAESLRSKTEEYLKHHTSTSR
jgi:hypothetical protein